MIPDIDTRVEQAQENETSAPIPGHPARCACGECYARRRAAVLALVVTGWNPATLPVAVAVLWWTGMVAGVAGVAALGAALRPSIPRRQPSAPPAIWHPWYVLDAEAAGGLTAALDATPDDLAAAGRQVAALARLVAGKFRWCRRGLWLLGLALVALALAGLVGQVAS